MKLNYTDQERAKMQQLVKEANQLGLKFAAMWVAGYMEKEPNHTPQKMKEYYQKLTNK